MKVVRRVRLYGFKKRRNLIGEPPTRHVAL